MFPAVSGEWKTSKLANFRKSRDFLSGIFCFIVTKSQPVPLFKICSIVILASEIFSSEYESILRKRHTHTKGFLTTLLSLVIVWCSKANGTGLQPCSLHLGKCLECQWPSLYLLSPHNQASRKGFYPAKTKKIQGENLKTPAFIGPISAKPAWSLINLRWSFSGPNLLWNLVFPISLLLSN